MANSGKTVLVTAGNGNQAKAVIPQLAASGFRVRAMRFSDRAGPGPADFGAHEVVVGDASVADDAYVAMQGVEAVYHVGPAFHPREREMGWNMIEQARRAGVGHFIYSSVLHPILTGLPQHQIKRDVEERLLESSLNFTILQPADYMQTVVFGILPEKSIFALGWNLDKRQALVDLDDIAEVLVKVITEDERHHGATYELTSGENFSAHDFAAALSEAFGRPFTAKWFEQRFEPNPRIFGHYDEAHARHQMDVFRVVNAWYDRFDFLGNSNVLRMLLGREPTSFVDFVRKFYGL